MAARTEDSTFIIRGEFQRFLLDLPHEQLRINALTDKLEVADEMSRIAQGICFGCVLFYRIFESQNYGTEGAELMSHLLQLLRIYEEFRARYQECCQFLEEQENNQSFRCETSGSCEPKSRGRPRFLVSKSQILALREIGFSWTKISNLLGISRITLYRRRNELGLQEQCNFSDISDQELDVFVKSIMDISPNSGEVMMRGALRGRAIIVQRWRLRESILRVDPLRKQQRQRLQIRRRVYSVAGPNSLWYVYRLISWKPPPMYNLMKELLSLKTEYYIHQTGSNKRF